MNGVKVNINLIEGANYVSLIGPFMNYYAKVPYARNNIEARWLCNQDRRLKSLWCSTYTLEQVVDCIHKYGGQVIELYRDGMEFDMDEFEKFKAEVGL